MVSLVTDVPSQLYSYHYVFINYLSKPLSFGPIYACNVGSPPVFADPGGMIRDAEFDLECSRIGREVAKVSD